MRRGCRKEVERYPHNRAAQQQAGPKSEASLRAKRHRLAKAWKGACKQQQAARAAGSKSRKSHLVRLPRTFSRQESGDRDRLVSRAPKLQRAARDGACCHRSRLPACCPALDGSSAMGDGSPFVRETRSGVTPLYSRPVYGCSGGVVRRHMRFVKRGNDAVCLESGGGPGKTSQEATVCSTRRQAPV